MSKELHDYELKYSPIEKQAYALEKAVDDFKTYSLSVHALAYVPLPLVKMMLNQPLREWKWVNWIPKLHEYEIYKWIGFVQTNLRHGSYYHSIWGCLN